ncbi:type I DNA topoisomerase [Phaeodactylibacter luteus]|uniref:DNA topoisomerase 1 n=1 Tax=Phaeodactylibacter luteus TaxID=1564516 RepID=A0A5C6RIT6_9BACT|nr:type I DNA topoisomerase [Phaeodactylibacter luteus]TXB61590.1 type I DNA topoisomerase [Phaeodactylibacter luteus]
MPKNLLIVESPAKAKTIEKILGKDFIVKSSFGHVRDLDKRGGAVDIENNFEPKYVISPEKQKVVRELKDLTKKSDEVWLATDEDREGEAISWHLCQVLGLDEKHTKRIVFREITKPAIQKAVTQPRTVDLNVVNAQQARRILDRLVGYELSGVLWKKVRGKLSAGRVQSVAVKLLVEREREIINFDPSPFFRVNALFDVKNEQGKAVKLKAENPSRFNDEKGAQQFLEQCREAAFEITDIDVKPLKRRPTAPFTTSTLQQEASRKLGFSVQRTMSVAQRLYEAGHITYMRTDSVALSETALKSIAQEITHLYGSNYLKTRRYKGKSAGAQEAHEAIRPTYINKQMASSDRDEQRLYELIWKRTIASQMSDAELEKTIVKVGISTVPDAYLKAEGEVLKFDGFLKVYLESTDDDDEEEEAKGMLPPLKVGQLLNLFEMTAIERFTRPPARYTEAALVKKLEELGIGRPSTYAPTISKIMEPERGYITKESRDGEERKYTLLTLNKAGKINSEVKTEVTGTVKNRLFATDMGMTVSDFLSEHFKEIMDYGFTADIEKQFDVIAEGQREWTQMLASFYKPFHETVEETIENAERPTRERVLGKDPETGRTVLTRMTRLGPVVQIGSPDELEEDEKPKYGNLRPGQSMETITYEEAMKLFELPRDMGEHEGEPVQIGVGRYGPYVRKGENFFVSIPKGEDPLKISRARALELINAKIKEDAPVGTYKGKPITKGKGRFGPFLKWDGMFVNVPRKYDFDTISLEEMHELIEQKVQKEANRYIHRWDDEKISVENGRWGPFIKFNKRNVKFPKVDGEKVTPEMAKEMTLEDVKKIIEAEIPDAFKKKKKAPAKKKPATGKKKAPAKPKAKK